MKGTDAHNATVPQSVARESGYGDIDRSRNPSEYVHRLDHVGASPFWLNVRSRMRALLNLQAGDDVLDVGCGTGDEARALSTVVGPTGRAVGVDASQTMIDEARGRGGEGAEFHQMDAHRLDFPDQSFAGCRAERVLQHIADPHQVLTEMMRVTRPLGRIVVVEPDHGALALVGADVLATRRVMACRREHFRSPRIGSQLGSLFRDLRLVDVQITLLTLTSTNLLQPGELSTIHRYKEQSVARGALTRTEADAWLNELQEAARAGRYRHSLPVFLVSGRRAR